MKIIDTGFAYWGIFMVTYAITIAGTAIISMTPANVGIVVTELKLSAASPNEKEIPKITKVVAFALLLVDNPPSKIPAAKKIKPKKSVSPVNACIPSINV